ncbi:hypothetical protein C5615_38355 [Burkholderia cepacia]|uniref:Putative tail fiber protein gp53-like C-terminal domain-containing protein n=1 Tax=Burkholderia cepacia TaxID=292 RepID=A0A2S8HXL8_BURCE|nr:hypothetical protein [Burkholderia cepacia]PQP06852.1 hypothetical protein C5615_38355 [Burkholderia cepacia]HDR9512194.1 hypothetical protein [Burkholderia cepacia]
MADLVEASKWEAGVYQLETSDPVEGGPDGIDNVQARQLGNRTRYLKDQHEGHVAADNPHPQYATIVQMKAAIDALVASAPGALDTLKELADALGDDPNFATTMTNALALKAALDSPEFTGTPKGPTPPQFDSSTKLANMAAVKAAGYQFSTLFNITVTQALTAAHIGAHIVCTPTAAITLTAPTISSLVARGAGLGAATRIENLSPYPVTITRGGTSDTFNTVGNSLGGVVIQGGDYVDLTMNTTGQWIVSGTGNLQYSVSFGSSLASSGYQRLPSGLIIQWMSGSSDANGNMTVVNPVAFQSAPLGGIANEASPGGWVSNSATVWGFEVGGSTRTTSLARVRNISGTGGPAPVSGVAGRILVWGY